MSHKSPFPHWERVLMCLSWIPAQLPKPAGRLIATLMPVTQSHGHPLRQDVFFTGCQCWRNAVTHFEGRQQLAYLKKQVLNKYTGPGAMFCCLTLSQNSHCIWAWEKKTGSRESKAKMLGKASKQTKTKHWIPKSLRNEGRKGRVKKGWGQGEGMIWQHASMPQSPGDVALSTSEQTSSSGELRHSSKPLLPPPPYPRWNQERKI